MATWTSSRYDGFPRPRSYFNPLKFKSMENYRYYTKLEEFEKATAEGREVTAAQQTEFDMTTANQTANSLKNDSTTTKLDDVGDSKKDSVFTEDFVQERKLEPDTATLKNIEGQSKGPHIEIENTKELEEEPVAIGENAAERKVESANNISRWDGFPRPGPSFNPLKFKSQANFEYYSKLEAQEKPAAQSVKGTEAQKVYPVATEAAKLTQSVSAIIGGHTDKLKKASAVDTKQRDMKEAEFPDRTITKASVSALLAYGKASRGAGTAHCAKGSDKQPNRVADENRTLGDKAPPTVTKQTYDATDTVRLVSIRKIKSIHETKVENRWLSLAQVDGWVCLVPHRAFKPDELILYLQIDSFIPVADERFGKQVPLITYGGELGHRVKTRRFGSGPDSLVVQGLVYPIEKIPDIHTELQIVRESMEAIKTSEKQINAIILALYRKENWAEKLGIRRWEETKQSNTAQQQQLRVGKIPTHLFPKTDISRLEDCCNLFIAGKYKTLEYQESVKMDGMSMTVYFMSKDSRLSPQLNAIPETTEVGPHMELENGRFGVCSKKVELHELAKDGNLSHWETAIRLDLPAKMARLGHNIAIQGELCGPNINKNRGRISGDWPEFFVFAIYHIETRKYIDPRKVVRMAQDLGLKHVPVLGYVKIQDIAANPCDLKKRAARGKGEGLVYKCLQDGRSFKVISNTYLLEHDV